LVKIKSLIVFLIIISCKQKKIIDFNENDYYKTQGYIIKVNVGYDNFHKTFTKRFVYAYRLDLPKPIFGITDDDYAWRLNEPVIIFVNKKDSLNSFVGYRGVIDKTSLNEFKEKIKADSLILKNY